MEVLLMFVTVKFNAYTSEPVGTVTCAISTRLSLPVGAKGDDMLTVKSSVLSVTPKGAVANELFSGTDAVGVVVMAPPEMQLEVR